MPTPEGLIKNAICAYLKLQGNFIFLHDSVGIYDPKINRFRMNNNRYRIKGVADILGIFKKTGRMVAIEVKTKTGRLTPHQEEFLKAVKEHGGIAFVARSVDDVMKELK